MPNIALFRSYPQAESVILHQTSQELLVYHCFDLLVCSCYCVTLMNLNYSFKTLESHNNTNTLTDRGNGYPVIPAYCNAESLIMAMEFGVISG